MTLKREIKDAYIEGGNSIYVKTHSNAVYVDENETETLTQRLDNKISYSTNSKVHFIKTKSKGGDCILIESAKNILIDVGCETTGAPLINYLNDNNINTIDYLIISHYHDDHVGGTNVEGLTALCDSSINIEKVILPHQKINYSLFVESDSYKVGEIIKGINDKVVNCCNTSSIPMYHPQDEEIIQLNDDSYIKFLNLKESNFNKYYNHTVNAYLAEENATNYNNFSMVVEYHSGNNCFLFTGDIEELAQESIYSQLDDNVDVLKIEHHSLNYNCCDKYLNKIHPKIAVAMPLVANEEVGVIKNQHFNELVNNGVPIYSSENGSVVIKSNYSGVCALTDSININRLETYNLSQGIVLEDGTDLDDCREVGIYNSVGANRTATMLNVPFSEAGFKLIVEKTSVYNCLKQTCIINNTQSSICYTRQTKDKVWGDWRRISPFNEIGMPISNIDLNNLKTPGEYYSLDTANTNTILNSPTPVGFRIEVTQLTPWTILQKVIANSDHIVEFYRYFSKNKWEPWYTYTNSKYLKSEIIKAIYGVGEIIAKNSDLNSYTKPGCFSCNDGTTSATVTNKPNGMVSGFRLEVKATNNNIRYQMLYANDNKISIYIRYYDVNGGGFTSWKKLMFENT